MTSRLPKTAAVVAAATALAAGAYAIGSQSNGAALAAKGSGSASDASGPPGWRGGPGPLGPELAARLGVSESRLRAALDALRAEAPGDTAFAAALAKAFGVDRSAVENALKAIRSQPPAGPPRGRFAPGRDPLASALAKRLGVSTAKARAAFDRAMRARFAAEEAEQASALAKALGLEESKVAAALRKVLPEPARRGAPPTHPPAGGPDAIVRRLATELGVSTADLRGAIDKVRAQRDREAQRRRDAFANKLADKLGIAADKVRRALAARPHGLAGPGGPPGAFAPSHP